MGSSTRVLHVDDESGFSELVEAVLQKETQNGTVIIASSAEEALKKLETTEVDCIVSDYDMPKKNGLELLTDVRKRDPDLPFILFTGKGSESIASEAITAGVTDYLQKGAGKEHYELLVNRIMHAVDQYRAEQEIRDTKEYYSTILSHTSDYIMIVDENGEVNYVSSAINRLMGFSPEEITGTNAFELVHPDDMDPAAETFSQVISNPGEEFGEEFRAKHNDGSWVWLEVRGKNLINDPVIEGIIVDARDITMRKEYEENLAVLTESLPKLFLSESQPDIIRQATDLAVQLIPDSAVAFYQNEDDDQLVPIPSSNHDTELTSISIDQNNALRSALDSADATRLDLTDDTKSIPITSPSDQVIVVPIETHGLILVTPDSPPVLSAEQLSLLDLLASNVSAAFKYLDWKDRIESREEMVTTQNQRLEEFTSIVSHDLRNPLNVAQGRLELAQTEVSSEHLEAVSEAHSRMLNLIEDLLGLAKYGDAVIEPEQVDLKQIAQSTWTDNDDSDVELIITDTIIEFDADPTQLRQLLSNLFRNAIEHGNGVNTVTLGGLPNGFFIEDDGSGIAAEDRDAVFRAGYSNSPDGTGFGLRIVELVVEAHKWDITLTSGEEGGARFEIRTS